MATVKDLGGGKYKITVEHGYDSKGKRKRRTKNITATGPRSIEKQIKAFERELENEQVVDSKNPLFNTVIDRWLDVYARPKYAGKTLDNYLYALKPIRSYFGNMKIKNILYINLEDFFLNEKADGRGSLVKKYDLLKSIFSRAIIWKMIAESPMEGLEKPKNPNKEMTYYKPKEISHLINEIETLSERHQLMILFSLIGALRRGELMAIALNDAVDFENNQIHIYRSLSHSKTKGLEIKRTKSEDERIVTFPAWLMKRLHSYYIELLKIKLEMGSAWKGFKDFNGQEVLLFIAHEDGSPFHPNAYTRFWGRFMKRTDIKRIRLHDLRHSSVTTMLKENVNMKVIQKRLGHKNIKTTLNTYAHISTEEDQEAADVFQKYVGK